MNTDTIAAIATALGESGIGVVRISGPGAIGVADVLAAAGRPRARSSFRDVPSHTVHHVWLHDAQGHPLDEVLVTVMRAPRTFTGEDLVEIGVHGGTIPARRVLRAALAAGSRLADRGEFTKRAFLNGRIDLSQAEAVADVIAARTETGADLALARLAGRLVRVTGEVESGLLDLLARLEVNLDFNEDVQAVDRSEIGRALDRCRRSLDELHRRAPWGRRIRDGATVVLVGRPNVGKSSLFNSLLQDDRALVSETPGTTRDWLEAWIDLEGIPVRLVDTAGQRHGTTDLESEGVRRARKLEREADLRLVVFDLAGPWSDDDTDVARRTECAPRIVVWNKIDLVGPGSARNGRPADAPALLGEGTRAEIEASAVAGTGIAELREAVARVLLEGVGCEAADGVVPTERHEEAIRRALESLALAHASWESGATEEFVAGDVRDAASALGEISGRTVGEEVLDRIFSKFCIGK